MLVWAPKSGQLLIILAGEYQQISDLMLLLDFAEERKLCDCELMIGWFAHSQTGKSAWGLGSLLSAACGVMLDLHSSLDRQLSLPSLQVDTQS
jgi:hypothetical protein